MRSVSIFSSADGLAQAPGRCRRRRRSCSSPEARRTAHISAAAGHRSGGTCRPRPTDRGPAARSAARISSAALLVKVRARICAAGDALLQQPGDAMRDDPGLAAARAGQDQQRSLDVRDRLALGLGQVFQERVQGGSFAGAGGCQVSRIGCTAHSIRSRPRMRGTPPRAGDLSRYSQESLPKLAEIVILSLRRRAMSRFGPVHSVFYWEGAHGYAYSV